MTTADGNRAVKAPVLANSETQAKMQEDAELWLRKDGTSEVFRYTPALAKRLDMLPITAEEARAFQQRFLDERQAQVRDQKAKASEAPAADLTGPTADEQLKTMDRDALTRNAHDLKVKVTDKMSDDVIRGRIIKALRMRADGDKMLTAKLNG